MNEYLYRLMDIRINLSNRNVGIPSIDELVSWVGLALDMNSVCTGKQCASANSAA